MNVNIDLLKINISADSESNSQNSCLFCENFKNYKSFGIMISKALY